MPALSGDRQVEGLGVEVRFLDAADFELATLGQAGRISGITPSDLAVLMIYLKDPARMAS